MLRRRAVRCAGLVLAADAQLLAADPDLLQVLEDLLGHAGGQVDEAVVVADVDAADVGAVDPGLVGDGADDVAGLDAVDVPDLDPERLFFDVVVLLPGLARPVVARLVVATLIPRVVVAGPFLAQPLRARRPLLALAARIGPGQHGVGQARVLLLHRHAAAGIGLQQQRAIALDQARQGGGDLDRRHVVLLLELFDQAAERRDVRRAEGLADLLLEAGDALVVDDVDAGHLHRRDRLARGALDGAQQVALARRDEQDGVAAAPGAAGAADAVDVGLGVGG